MRKIIKNKTELRNFIINAYDYSDFYKKIHFYVADDGKHLTWDIWGVNENIYSSAIAVIPVRYMSLMAENSTKKERNIAISNSFELIENGDYEIA